MKRVALFAVLFSLLGWGVVALAQTTSAQPAASSAPTASATPSPSAKPAPSPSGQMPPGHPLTGQAPPGQGQRQRIPDRVMPDKNLEPGTVAVMIIDADDRPVANAPVELAILFSSVTKGESRERQSARTDDKGQHTFTGLKHGSGISYRVVTTNGMASFSSQPFGLTDQGGIRVLQHRYDAITRLAESRLLIELHIILDLKQDNVAIHHLLSAVNLGREAYVATDFQVPFPEGYEGFSAQESMEGGGARVVERDGVLHLEGTFPPGDTQLTYRYQMPLEGGDTLDLTLPIPPRVAIKRVVLKGNEEMGLEVAGLPPAELGRFRDGSKVHETRSKPPQTLPEVQAAFSNNTPTKLSITIKGIPTPGLKRTLAVLLALLAMAGGAFYVYQRRNVTDAAPDLIEDLEQAKATLLDEIALLERMHQRAEVGPRTYQSLRNQLLDALARIMARLDAARPEPDEPDRPRKQKRRKRRKRRKRAAATS